MLAILKPGFLRDENAWQLLKLHSFFIVVTPSYKSLKVSISIRRDVSFKIQLVLEIQI